jgi:hypothetical protein
MTHRGFVGGRIAAWLGLVLLLGSAGVTAAPVLGMAPWAGPFGQAGPPAGYAVPPAPRVAPWPDAAAAAAAAHYRWRPVGPARAIAPAPVVAWGPRHAPPPWFGRPVPAQGPPRFLPRPRLADHRPAVPLVLNVDGRVFRFRPTRPWPVPALAYGPPPPVHAAYAFAPGVAPWQPALAAPVYGPPPPVHAAYAFAPGVAPWQPALAAPAPRPPPPGVWSSPPVYGGAWAQAGPAPIQDGGHLYRFRPDARFAYGPATPAGAPYGGAAYLYN